MRADVVRRVRLECLCERFGAAGDSEDPLDIRSMPKRNAHAKRHANDVEELRSLAMAEAIKKGPKDMALDGSHPALLDGYGGFECEP